MLEVGTDKKVTCRYSTSKGISYDIMEGTFENNFETLHKKSFTNLVDGIYKYYIKCTPDPYNITSLPELEAIFKVSTPVSAKILLSSEPPLKAGKVGITLIASKIISQSPALSYSFDGIRYSPVPLSGSGTTWNGYLFIPKSTGEAIGSFKFQGTDLEGRVSEEIIGTTVFLVDTVPPSSINDLSAVGYEGNIKLSWYFDDEANHFNIYRSNSPNLDYTDFYKSIDEKSYTDNNVEKGKTYYYRVAVVDDAGNEGDLSREVYATVLFGNTSTNGLSLELRGYLDNFIAEINSVASDVESIKSSISLKDEQEKSIFTDLNLDKELDNSKSELSALKRDAEGYKSQDLTRKELEDKLNSARLKLNVIKKKIPESLIIIDKKTETKDILSSDIESAILGLNPDISENEKEESVKISENIAKNCQIKLSAFNLEVVYLDGTRKEATLIEQNINLKEENKQNFSFIETIPKEIAQTVSEIDFKNLNYRIVKEDPIISFIQDRKSVV
jgi:hypothetical protein